MRKNEFFKKRLQLAPVLANNTGLTKNHERHSNVSNIAFFVPKIYQACNLLKGYMLDLGIKNEVRIPKYGRVKAQNTRPVYSGNMCNRLVAISDTRSPVTKTGEQILLKPRGGQTMPLNTSKALTVGQFSFSIQLPDDSYIERLIANYSCERWQLWIETTKGQKRPILNTDNQNIKQFKTLDSLAFWLGSQGFSLMTVYLPDGDGSNMGGRA